MKRKLIFFIVSMITLMITTGLAGCLLIYSDGNGPEISLDLPSFVYEGEVVTIEPVVSDVKTPTELITVNISVTKDGQEIVLENNSFVAVTGVYSIMIRAKDDEGNVTEKIQNLTVLPAEVTDVTKPTIFFEAPESAIEGDIVTLNVYALDDNTAQSDIVLTLALKHEGEEVVLENNSFTAKIGTYVLTVTAIDGDNNQEIKEFTFYVSHDPSLDNESPVITLNLPENVNMYDKVEVKPVVSDNKTDANEIEVTTSVKLGEEEVELEDNAFYAKQGTYTVTVTATDEAGNTQTEVRTINAKRFVYQKREGYPNNARLVVSNAVDSAEYYMYARYEEDGFVVLIDAIDPYVNIRNADLGMNDNVEVQLTPLTTEINSQNKLKIMVNPFSGKGWVHLSDGTGWSDNFYDFFVETGAVSITTREGDQAEGYMIEIKVAYDLLNVTYESVLDRMSIAFSARNTASNNDSYWAHCSILGSQWNYTHTFMRVRSDRTIEPWNYDMPNIEQLLEYSGGKHEDKDYATNKANLSLVDGEETFFRDYARAQNFYCDIAPEVDRIAFKQLYCVSDRGYWEDLKNSSYVYGSQYGGYTVKVEGAGYVISVISGVSANNEIVNNLMQDGWSLLASGMPSIRKHSADYVWEEHSSTYLIKWCEAGESFVSPGNGIIFFGAQESESYQDEWVRTSAQVTYITTQELVKKYGFREDGYGFGGTPTIVAVPKDNGGTRFWMYLVDGGDTEPHGDNYMAFYYSDDDCVTWNFAFILDMPNTDNCDLWSSSPMGNINDYCRVQEGTIYYAEGSLYIFATQAANFSDGMEGVWWAKLTNPGVELNSLEDNAKLNIVNADGEQGVMTRIGDGLINNGVSPVHIEDSESGKTYRYMIGVWMVGGNSAQVDIYVSTNMEDWTFWSNAHVYTATCWIEVSFVQGLDYDGNDVLYMTYRGNQGYYHGRQLSYDNGKTWIDEGEYLRSEDGRLLHTTNSKSKIIKLKSGNILLLYHYDTGARTNLAAFLSTDGGATFSDHVLILDDRHATHGCSYPSAVEQDGYIYIVWDYDRIETGDMVFAKITEQQLLDINGVLKDTSIMRTLNLEQSEEE